jgi:hypothetical protein
MKARWPRRSGHPLMISMDEVTIQKIAAEVLVIPLAGRGGETAWRSALRVR